MRSANVVPNQVALAQQFANLRADARAASNLLVQQMLGSFNLSTNPTNGKTLTLTINGNAVVFTFVTSIGTTPGNVLIGASAAATVVNLLSLLNQPQTTTLTGIALSTPNQLLVSYVSCYSASSTTLYVTSSNATLYGPLAGFSAATNATSDSWTSNTMALYVHKGVVYVNGTRVLFAGGISGTVTAPSSHPRIDILSIDNTGTLNWTTGTESASPVAPTYPSNQVLLCELYNVVAETALFDFDNQQTGQGYIYNDVRPFMQVPFIPGAIPDDLLPDGDGTRNLGSASFEWNNIYAKSGIFLNGASINSQITTALTAATNFLTAQPAFITPTQTDGGIQMDTHGGASTSNSYSITIGSNNNRMLVIFVMGADTSGGVSGVTFNGVAMTLIDTSVGFQGQEQIYTFILPAPATGTHTLAITTGTGTCASRYWSLYNASQSTTPDAHAKASNTGANATGSVTTVANGALVLAGAMDGLTNQAAYENTGNNSDSGGFSLYGGDSGQVFPAGASVSATSGNNGGGNPTGVNLISIAPITSVAYEVGLASSAAATSQFFNKYSSFLGFSAAPISLGTSGSFVTAGVAIGFSGLIPSAQYYLNDTPGTIGTSPGTNTRKVGIAISATTLLITNEW